MAVWQEKSIVYKHNHSVKHPPDWKTWWHLMAPEMKGARGVGGIIEWYQCGCLVVRGTVIGGKEAVEGTNFKQIRKQGQALKSAKLATYVYYHVYPEKREPLTPSDFINSGFSLVLSKYNMVEMLVHWCGIQGWQIHPPIAKKILNGITQEKMYKRMIQNYVQPLALAIEKNQVWMEDRYGMSVRHLLEAAQPFLHAKMLYQAPECAKHFSDGIFNYEIDSLYLPRFTCDEKKLCDLGIYDVDSYENWKHNHRIGSIEEAAEYRNVKACVSRKKYCPKKPLVRVVAPKHI